MTLVLDLDETLVRSSMDPRADCTYDMQLNCWIEQMPVKFYVKKRPHLDLFLNNVSSKHHTHHPQPTRAKGGRADFDFVPPCCSFHPSYGR